MLIPEEGVAEELRTEEEAEHASEDPKEPESGTLMHFAVAAAIFAVIAIFASVTLGVVSGRKTRQKRF